MLDIENIKKRNKDVYTKKRKIYRKMLYRIYKRINRVSKQGCMYCSFTLTNVYYTVPLFDIHECRSYIEKKLEQKGLRTVYDLATSTLYIRWDML